MKNVWLLLGAALLLSVAPTAQAQTNPKHFFWAQGSPNAALPTEFPTAATRTESQARSLAERRVHSQERADVRQPHTEERHDLT